MHQVFDPLASNYDQWYDTPEGSALFEAEWKCLQTLHSGSFADWVEVGVGTGRFVQALGVPTGVDPAPNMLAFAARRGINVCAGKGEHLPFADKAFAGVLMAFTLCFVEDIPQTLKECRRILPHGGSLLLGIIPLESPWGRLYQQRGAAGHPFYAHARIISTEYTIHAAQTAGFALSGAASSLFWLPDTSPETPLRIDEGITSEAGFVALRFRAV